MKSLTQIRYQGTETVCKIHANAFNGILLLLFSTLWSSFATRCPNPSNDGCLNYKVLDEPHRSSKFSASNTDRLICDNGLTQGWYRFKSNGHDVNMPTSCVDVNHCGTVDPIWLQGTLPSVKDGAVERFGCINHGKYGLLIYGGTTCCHEKMPICVKNCKGFYTYYLNRVPGCSVAYCAGDKITCPYGKYGTNCANDLYPKMTSTPILQSPKCKNSHLFFTCHIPYDPTDLNAKFEVTWTVDGKLLTIPPTVLSGGQRDASLDAIHLNRNMGKRLRCNVTSYYTPNLRSDIQSSNGIFCGIIFVCAITKNRKVGTPLTVVSDNSRTTPPAITVSENGGPQQITLATSLPYCAPQGPDCNFAVEIKASDNCTTDTSTNGCTYGFKYNGNTQKCEATISFKATRDFVNDGDKTHTLSFRPIEHSSHGHPTIADVHWIKHQISPIQVTTIDKKKATCHVYTDPHMETLGGHKVDVYVIGDLLLYKAPSVCNGVKIRPLEIHIRTRTCTDTTPWSQACMCGIIAKEGNDILEVNGCTKRKNVYHLSIKQYVVDGATIHTDTSGKKFYFNFPSGARITITSDTILHILGHTYIEIPSDHAGCSTGSCGTFRGELVDPKGKVIPTSGGNLNFARSWLLKPGTSLFYANHTNNPRYNIVGHEYCQCKNNQTDCSGSASNPLKNKVNGGKAIPIKNTNNTPRGKRSYNHLKTRTQDETVIIHKRSAEWPTKSGKTQMYATKLCRNTLQRASLYRYCGNTFDGYSDMMYGCVEDIKLTDSLDYVNDYILVYNEACQGVIAGDINYYVRGPDGQLTLPTYVTSDLCPNECSFKGVCHHGQCQCNSGYQGPDCSVLAGTIPVITSIHGDDDVDGMCDVRQQNCVSAYVVAENLMYTNHLKCRLQYYSMQHGKLVKVGQQTIVDALFRTFNEIECPLPNSMVSNGVVAGGFKISVTTDNKHFSREETLIIYDSLCQSCQEDGSCALKADACLIEGHCRHRGEQNSKHQVCEPSVNGTSWTTDHNVQEIDHFTASLTGCECVDDPGTYTCGCCQNGGCPCAFRAPHQCTDCKHLDECGKYPDLFNIV